VTRSADQRLSDLYAAHATGVRRLAYLATGDPHEAEDLLQEAFVRLAGRLLTLRDPERAAGYLYRTVINLARDHGRRLRRDRELREHLAPETPIASQDLGDRGQVWSALLKLPVRHRAVLFFRYYMDLSEAQTAEILNCSTSAVKSLNHRASQSLKNQLEETGHE
jgi:RNA polymerase sigma-70 factor (sigma-E family)